MTPWYVYMVRCSDNTLYCGATNNVADRVDTHNSGKGAKYTRCRLPVTLVYLELIGDRGKALSREYAIKQLSKEEKENLVALYRAGKIVS